MSNTLTVIYEHDWGSYEESFEMQILENQKGQLFVREGGYNVMKTPDQPYWQDIEPVTYQEALVLIDECEEFSSTDEGFV